MTIPIEIKMSPEMKKAHTDYNKLFGTDYCPLEFVGFARIYEAIETKTQVPYSEYKKRFTLEEDAPNHCGARTPEEEQLMIEYESLFGEECPYDLVELERISKAIKEEKSIPISEYEHLLDIV